MKTHGFSYEGSSVFIREPIRLQLRAHLYFFAKLVNLSEKSGKQTYCHKLHSSWQYPQ